MPARRRQRQRPRPRPRSRLHRPPPGSGRPRRGAPRGARRPAGGGAGLPPARPGRGGRAGPAGPPAAPARPGKHPRVGRGRGLQPGHRLAAGCGPGGAVRPGATPSSSTPSSTTPSWRPCWPWPGHSCGWRGPWPRRRGPSAPVCSTWPWPAAGPAGRPSWPALALAGAHFAVAYSRLAYTYNLLLLWTACCLLAVIRLGGVPAPGLAGRGHRLRGPWAADRPDRDRAALLRRRPGPPPAPPGRGDRPRRHRAGAAARPGSPPPSTPRRPWPTGATPCSASAGEPARRGGARRRMGDQLPAPAARRVVVAGGRGRALLRPPPGRPAPRADPGRAADRCPSSPCAASTPSSAPESPSWSPAPWAWGPSSTPGCAPPTRPSLPGACWARPRRPWWSCCPWGWRSGAPPGPW